MNKRQRDQKSYTDNLVKRAGVVVQADLQPGDFPRVQVQALAKDLKDSVPVLMPYGIYSRVNPLDANGHAAETVLFAIGPDHYIALPIADRRYIPSDLVDGELIIYTAEDEGAPFRIKFGAGRHLTIEGADVTVNVTGDVTVNAGGNATINADDTARIDADKVRIRSEQSTIIECNGNGFEIKPDRTHTWQNDQVAGVSNDIHPSELPES